MIGENLRSDFNSHEMNVLIIEQEPFVAQKVREMLHGVDDSIRIVGITGNIPTTAEWLSNHHIPDVILANRKIIDQVAEQVEIPVKTTVTFSTHLEEFQFNAFRYKTMRHILANVHREGDPLPAPDEWDEDPPISLGNRSWKERFLVKQGQKLVSVPVHRIAYFFSEGRFIFFKTTDNQKFLSEYRVEQLDTLLSPDLFFRINRSMIISHAAVREIHPYFGNRLKIYLAPSLEREVIVSRKRTVEFKRWLGK